MPTSVNYHRSVQDSLGVADAVLETAHTAWTVAVADGVGMAEAISRLAPAARTIQEAVVVREIIARQLAANIVLAELIGLKDFFVALFPRQLPILITDLVHHPAAWSIPAPAVGQEWDMVAGEDRSYVFLPDTEGSLLDISGWNIRWELRQTDGGAIVFDKDTAAIGGVTVTDGPNGVIGLLLADADTLNLPVQSLPWFWELRRDDGGNSTTLARGTLTIEQPVVE